jgi:hypothetical protein
MRKLDITKPYLILTPPLTEIDLFKTKALVSRQLAQQRAHRDFTPTPHPRVPMNFIPVRYALP